MSQGTANVAPPPEAVDAANIEQMGRDVVEQMRVLRELLDARTRALEACRESLVEHYRVLDEQRASFSGERDHLCQDVERREQELAVKLAEFEKLKEEAHALTEVHEQRMAELEQCDKQNQQRLERAAGLEADLAQRESALTAAKEEIALQKKRIAEESGKLESVRAELTAQAEKIKQEQQSKATRLAFGCAWGSPLWMNPLTHRPAASPLSRRP
jgi:chromosome segregation ATPase